MRAVVRVCVNDTAPETDYRHRRLLRARRERQRRRPAQSAMKSRLIPASSHDKYRSGSGRHAEGLAECAPWGQQRKNSGGAQRARFTPRKRTFVGGLVGIWTAGL